MASIIPVCMNHYVLTRSTQGDNLIPNEQGKLLRWELSWLPGKCQLFDTLPTFIGGGALAITMMRKKVTKA